MDLLKIVCPQMVLVSQTKYNCLYGKIMYLKKIILPSHFD